MTAGRRQTPGPDESGTGTPGFFVPDLCRVRSVFLLVIGSGEAGKYLAWTFSKEGQRTAVIEKRLGGGSCPNVACLPSKNIIHSAKVASLADNSEMFGVSTGATSVDMVRVQQRKQTMVNQLIDVHQTRYDDSGVELIMGEATFVAPSTVEVALNDGETKKVTSTS